MSIWEHFINEATSLEDLLDLYGRFLSSEDYIKEEDGKVYLVETRARVENLNGYKIEIYPNEHPPPHFHVVKGKEKLASFNIANCDMTKGSLPSNVEKKVRFFYDHSKDKLVLFWNRTRPDGCCVGKIELS